MRPRIKPDFYWTEVPEGVFLLGSSGQRTLKGQSLQGWISRLAPFLDGSQSLQEITSGLPRTQRDMVNRLVEVLTEAGYIVDASNDAPHDLSDDELRAFEETIAYVAHHRSSPERAFQNYHRARLLVVGRGLGLRCLIHAALRAGAGKVLAATSVQDENSQSTLAGFAQRGMRNSQLQRIDFVEGTDSELPSLIADADAVLHIDAADNTEQCRLIEQSCRDSGVLLSQAQVLAGSAWIGPLRTGSVVDDWSSLRSRLSSAQQATANPDPEDDGYPLAGPTGSLVAHHLNFRLLRQLAGLRVDDEPYHFTEIDLATLTSHERNVVPIVPTRRVACRSESSLVARLEKLSNGPVVDDSMVAELSPHLFDPKVGIFTDIDEREFTQVPLHVVEVTSTEPGPPTGNNTVIGTGTNFADARIAATRAATETYAYSALTFENEQIAQEQRTAHATWWSTDLSTRIPEQVERTETLPLPDIGHPGRSRPSGVAAGTSWAEAEQEAVLSAAAALSAYCVEHCGAVPTSVDISNLSLGEASRRWLGILRATDAEYSVLDLTGVLGIPTYALEIEGRTCAYRSAREPERAIEACLRAAVMNDQARRNDDTDALLSIVPQAPQPDRRSNAVTSDREALSSQRSIAEELLTKGFRSLVNPLDAGAGLRRAFPYIAQVVITNA